MITVVFFNLHAPRGIYVLGLEIVAGVRNDKAVLTVSVQLPQQRAFPEGGAQSWRLKDTSLKTSGQEDLLRVTTNAHLTWDSASEREHCVFREKNGIRLQAQRSVLHTRTFSAPCPWCRAVLLSWKLWFCVCSMLCGCCF